MHLSLLQCDLSRILVNWLYSIICRILRVVMPELKGHRVIACYFPVLISYTLRISPFILTTVSYSVTPPPFPVLFMSTHLTPDHLDKVLFLTEMLHAK